MSNTHRNDRGRLAAEQFDRIAEIAALEARRIGELDLSDRPEDLLANIGRLVALSDVARWALARGDHDLTADGRAALADLRALERVDLKRVLAEQAAGQHWFAEDIALYWNTVQMFDRAMEAVA